MHLYDYNKRNKTLKKGGAKNIIPDFLERRDNRMSRDGII